MIQRSQQFDKVNTVGVTEIFFLLNFWLESAVWEKRKWAMPDNVERKTKPAESQSSGQENGKPRKWKVPPRGSKFHQQSPAVQKVAVWVTANWRGGIPNILWNSLITWQVSTPCWESPFLQQHVAVLFLSSAIISSLYSFYSHGRAP